MCRCPECPECIGIGVRIRFQSLASKAIVVGILHKCHVFHLFSNDGADDGLCLVLLRPMVVSEGNGHVDGVHSAKVVLGQVAGRESLRASGHPRR
jgi:hypothetical protein